MSIFNSGDLLKYLYNETSVKKTAAIKAALETNFALREKFEKLVAGQKLLEDIKLSPREEVLKNILSYGEKEVTQVNTP